MGGNCTIAESWCLSQCLMRKFQSRGFVLDIVIHIKATKSVKHKFCILSKVSQSVARNHYMFQPKCHLRGEVNVKYIKDGMLRLREACVNFSMPSVMYFILTLSLRWPLGWNNVAISYMYLTLLTITVVFDFVVFVLNCITHHILSKDSHLRCDRFLILLHHVLCTSYDVPSTIFSWLYPVLKWKTKLHAVCEILGHDAVIFSWILVAVLSINMLCTVWGFYNWSGGRL
jgi:hypothetical protein